MRDEEIAAAATELGITHEDLPLHVGLRFGDGRHWMRAVYHAGGCLMPGEGQRHDVRDLLGAPR